VWPFRPKTANPRGTAGKAIAAQAALATLIHTGLLLASILTLVTIRRQATAIETGPDCSPTQKLETSQKQATPIETGPFHATIQRLVANACRHGVWLVLQ